MVYRFYMILIGEKKIEERKVIVVYHTTEIATLKRHSHWLKLIDLFGCLIDKATRVLNQNDKTIQNCFFDSGFINF